MTNPTIPSEFTNVTISPIVLEKHVIVGSGSVVLPGAHLGEGVAVGALSMVNRPLEPWGIYGGVPVRKLKDRCDALLGLEEQYVNFGSKKQ